MRGEKGQKYIIYSLGLHQNKKQLNQSQKKDEELEMQEKTKNTTQKETENTTQEEKVITVLMDLGWGNGKFGWIDENLDFKKDIIPSRVKKINKGSEIIKIDSEFYDFRCDESIIDSEKNKVTKDTTSHKVLAQKVLYEVYKETKATKFKVFAGCGLDSYKEDKGEKVKNALFTKKFKIGDPNEDQVELEMCKMDMCPETLTGVNSLGLRLKDRIVIAIDIGYLNFSMVEINNMIPNFKKVIITANGMHKLLDDICKSANTSTVGKLHINDVETMDKVLRNINAYDETTQQLVKVGVDQFLDRIEKLLEGHFFVNSKFKDLTLAFVGGGSQTLQKYINTYFKGKGYKVAMDKDNNAIFSNLEGMYKKALKEETKKSDK